jgi:hypothetical protein
VYDHSDEDGVAGMTSIALLLLDFIIHGLFGYAFFRAPSPGSPK